MENMNNDFTMQFLNNMSDEEFIQFMINDHQQQQQQQPPFHPAYDGNSFLSAPASVVGSFPDYEQGQVFRPPLLQNNTSVVIHPLGDEYFGEANGGDEENNKKNRNNNNNNNNNNNVGSFHDVSILGASNNQQEQFIDPKLFQKTDSVVDQPQVAESTREAKDDEEGNNDASSDFDSIFDEKEVEEIPPSSPDSNLLEEHLLEFFRQDDIANQSLQVPEGLANSGPSSVPHVPPVPAPAFPLALPLALPSPPLPWTGSGNKQKIAGDASQRTVEAGHMADIPLQSPSPAEPVPRASPAAESIVEKVLAPNTKGKRVAKTTGNKKVREVKANSCDACRRSKTRCVREEGAASCNLCTKKKCDCYISGTDGRTNKTNQKRLDAAAAAVNDYLKDAVLLCSELVEHSEQRETAQALLKNMGDFRQVRAIISGLTRRPLKEFQFAMGPFRPPFCEGTAKLSETRNQRIPQLKQMALEQGEIVGSLLIMLAFSGPSQFEEASRLVAGVMLHNNALVTLKHSVQQYCYFPPGVVHPVYQQIRQGVEERISAALA
ncbi:hypothetical protein CI238_06949 [Colletotrichum incanum]|uniref:Zn(2)-C6 fungal-type domain-containing protein n=1 Tax=Colletotrichum incanum TaxID=1573173 RepID=A0A161Y3E9_COLIC|nr:hypothetical protein CI238_06949 [Colletotrichum incanum]